MNIRFNTLNGLLGLITVSSLLPAAALAGTPSPNDLIEQAFFSHDGNFYQTTSLTRQVNEIFGLSTSLLGDFSHLTVKFPGNFSDNAIARDSELVNIVYRDMLAQQSTQDPYMRTQDLPNPYTTSVLDSYTYTNQPKLTTESQFETTQP